MRRVYRFSSCAFRHVFAAIGVMSAIDDLQQTMARLRAPDGCPWDQEQTHASLVRCLIDEVSELIDTIDRTTIRTCARNSAMC